MISKITEAVVNLNGFALLSRGSDSKTQKKLWNGNHTDYLLYRIN